MRGRNRQISRAVHNSPCLRKSLVRRILGRWLNTACALNGARTSWGMKEGKKRKKKKEKNKSEHKVIKLILNFVLFLFSRCWVLDIKNHPLTNCRLGHTQLPALLLSHWSCPLQSFVWVKFFTSLLRCVGANHCVVPRFLNGNGATF